MEELKDDVKTDSYRTHLSVVERYYTPRFILGITILSLHLTCMNVSEFSPTLESWF